MERVRSAIGDRTEPRAICALAVLLGTLAYVFEIPLDRLSSWLVGSILVGLGSVAAEALDLEANVAQFAFGGTVLTAGSRGVFDGGTPTWVTAATALFGCWILFDAVQALRHEEYEAAGDGWQAEPPAPDGHAVYRGYLERQIRDLVREAPRSRADLEEALEADPAAVDEVLSDLEEGSLLERRAGIYHPDSPPQTGEGRPSLREGLHSALDGVPTRIARPITVEYTRPVAPDDERHGRPRTE